MKGISIRDNISLITDTEDWEILPHINICIFKEELWGICFGWLCFGVYITLWESVK